MKQTLVGIAGIGLLCAFGYALYAYAGAEAALKGVTALGLALLLLALLFLRRARAALGARFSRIQTEVSKSSTNFQDVAANAEARESLTELRDYLAKPDKYERMGARMPRGVLLYGPPGTGKTLLARALAGEAGVPFFPLSGSDFVQMYVGVGAGRVRDLFQKARKAGRCVIFIDEIDAIGKRRDENANDEREQTLNALLSEMSGFRESSGVLVLAATNRVEALDPALLRPGRFDRRIEVGLPSREARLAILRLHARGKPLAGVDLEALAAETVRFSGASLESLMNEAAIRAARRDSDAIEQRDVDEALLTSVVGAEGGGKARDAAAVALHEAGHALLSRLRLPRNRIKRVSILPSRGMAGYNFVVPDETALPNREELEAQLEVLLAGRAAESLENGARRVTSGASNDLARAAELAGAMVMELGMGDSEAVSLKALARQCGCEAREGLEAAKELLAARYQSARDLLEAHHDALLALTDALLEKETLGQEDIDRILERKNHQNYA